jgi:hypothetical protein
VSDGHRQSESAALTGSNTAVTVDPLEPPPPSFPMQALLPRPPAPATLPGPSPPVPSPVLALTVARPRRDARPPEVYSTRPGPPPQRASTPVGRQLCLTASWPWLAAAAAACHRRSAPPPPPPTTGAPRFERAARESAAMPTESPHSHLITLAAEEAFSWHHHFGPSPAFLPSLRPPMDDPTLLYMAVRKR